MSIITRLTHLPRVRILILVLLTFALTLGLTVKLPVKVQAQSEPPPLSSLIPDEWEVVQATDLRDTLIAINREAGGTRCGCLSLSQAAPITLVPLSGIGKTVAEYPTIFWFIPKTNAWGIKFVLYDANDKEVYSTQYKFAHYTQKNSYGHEFEIVEGTPGIISLTLPGLATRPPLLTPLKIGQKYRWQLRIICNPNESSGDSYIDGGIERVQFNPLDERFLAQATLEERLAFYAKERIWYETVGTLIELLRERPDDQDVTNAWNKLLKSVGLEYTFLSAHK
ncbi:MAG: DUF928 domain-containing protein [Coleofasciculus sp. G3-WIS-01]|uniref:DUF928 domain-containing protein n=1 Tax=Coleofasciculus sp. G3-WIS-01 TaxID=3069528 RepID=UPI0032F62FFF